MTEFEDRLRSLALSDEGFIEGVLHIDLDSSASRLGAREHALVRLGAMLALDAAPSSYQMGVDAALAAGSTPDEVLEVVIAIAPVIGITRVVSAAPELALALGYDVDAALEQSEEHGGGAL